MNITLTNFRCHTDATFTFPESGFISLIGQNGAGKSSVLAGISYALYGKIPGKNKTVYAHNKTTASVELNYLGLQIQRSAKPKRLLVKYQEVDYEDDNAQSIIISTIGMTYHEFVISCYIIQRSTSLSVISKTAKDQVKFVETLANSAEIAEDAKTRTKNFIKEIEKGVSEIKGEIKALVAKRDEKLSIYETPPKIPEDIENGIDPDTIREELAAMERKSQKMNAKMEKANDELTAARQEDKRSTDLQVDITRLTNEIASLKKRLFTIQAKINDSAIDNAKLRADEITGEMASLKAWIAAMKEKEMHDSAVASFWKDITTRIKRLEQIMVAEEDLNTMEQAIDEAETETALYEETKARINELEKRKKAAKKALVDLFKDIKANLNVDPSNTKSPNGMLAVLHAEKERLIDQSKIARECPCCNEKIVISFASLSLETPEIGIDYADDTLDHRATINAITDCIAKISEAKKDFSVKIPELGPQPPLASTLGNVFNEELAKRREYEKLVKKELPLALEKQKARLEEFLAANEREGTVDDAEAELEGYENEYRELRTRVGIADNDQKEADDLKTNIELKEQLLAKKKKTVSTLPSPVSVTTLERNISKLIADATDLSTKISQHRSLLDNFAEYETYLETARQIEDLDNSIKEAEDRNGIEEIRLDGFAGLVESEKEAEILALEETVNSINEHAKIYLDSFFQDPIIVRLECSKDKGKKGLKLQLNTYIEYKGDTYGVEEMSGGELQRCEMAFILAVNDMIGGKLLIFDESFNELDSQTNSEVLTLVRDVCAENNKLVLIVSHEAVRGIFDEEIEVSH